MVSSTYYIDTGSGGSPFAPGADVDDYQAWLLSRYRPDGVDESGLEIFSGVSQKINQAIFGCRRSLVTAVAIGPYAEDAAVVIEYLSGFSVAVAVLRC